MSICLRFILPFLILIGNVAVAQEQRMVCVGIFDETKVQRISSRAEIWFKGRGSVWLDSACYRLRNGSLSCSTIDLGMRQIDQTSELFLYVNGRKLDAMGRETNEIKINIKMTSSMCKPGCDEDAIIITISDDKVEVFGNPVKAQNGKWTLTFKRFAQRGDK